MKELLDRFCRYVRLDTTASPGSDKRPSSPGQLKLGKMLIKELKSVGIDAHQRPDGLVHGYLHANREGAPTIAWLSHLDTSPDCSGANIKPNVVKNYDGGDIVLPGDPSKVIRPSRFPELKKLKGKTLITTDGTTLLGADDKAGVAVMMQAAAQLARHPELPRGNIHLLFTCDEEIGRGTDGIDIGYLAASCAYTLDGNSCGYIENETFSADGAFVNIKGVPMHPGLAYGEMVNAVRVAADFLGRLPRELGPEHSRDRQPFIHPFKIEGVVDKVQLRFILRSFDTDELPGQADLIRQAAAAAEEANPGAEIEVQIFQQYRNTIHFLDKEPRAVSLAQEAFRRIGIEPQFHGVRGGTDGSRLSQKGLPTPNLSVGMYNYHSVLEFACLEEMDTAVRMLIELAGLWAEQAAVEVKA